MPGQQKPSDYKVVIGALGMDTSTRFTVARFDPPRPAIPVNFSVYNTSENKKIQFAFVELDTTGGPGSFSARVDNLGNNATDAIVFLERDLRDSLVITWSVTLNPYDTLLRRPQAGDTATIVLSKLFRSGDVFEFKTTGQKVSAEKAKSDLDRIKVVPNPYIAAATWETSNPYSSGRGPRSIHFNHLPQQCTIRIYTVSGELVAAIEHDSNLLDGMAEWNLLTRDNLSAAYGIYIFHVDAPGVGQKIGKFAVIK
jgi:hypothetical protein